jgi:hypothetical protein
LGFAALPEPAIEEGVSRLVRALWRFNTRSRAD